MATFALVHGSGDGGWAWHLVRQALRERGHDAVAPDLPTDREDATWDDCVGTVVEAVGTADDVVVVGHSSGGFVVPLVADRLGATMQVFVVGMVPQPGETAQEWFARVDWATAAAEQSRADGGRTGDPDPMVAFHHDVPDELAARAMARERPVSGGLGERPLPPWGPPTSPARYVVTTRDRFIPPRVQQQVAADRLGITAPDTIDTGHCPNLARPDELAALLAGFLD